MSSAELVTGYPSAGLRPYVRFYLGYRYAGYRPGTHVGLPSTDLTIVVGLAAPTRVAWTPSGPTSGYRALASGLVTGPVYLPHDGSQFGVQVPFTPAGARALFGMPAAALAGTVVALDDLLGPAAAVEAVERMRAAGTWPGRFAVLDEVLARRGVRSGPPAGGLDHAWRRVLGSGGTVRIGELAAETGWSRRHLAARFTAEYGVTPKDAARVARFARSRALLLGPDRPVLADVASRCGYYDQSHLARDWRALAGVAPSAWLVGEELPILPSQPPGPGDTLGA